MTDGEKLEKLASEVVKNENIEMLAAELAKSAVEQQNKPSAQAMAVADQMVHRAAAAMADVHSHAMARVGGMREQLNELEKTIVEARERAEVHMSKFMQLVTDGEESIRSMEQAIARVEDHLTNR